MRTPTFRQLIDFIERSNMSETTKKELVATLKRMEAATPAPATPKRNRKKQL